jgi:isoleucyl-tRNA synthetase
MYPDLEGQKNIYLTEKGENQVKKSAKELKNHAYRQAGKGIDLIYFSDVNRTRQTAEIVNKELDAGIAFDTRLRDVNLGVYHGGRKDKFYRDFPKNLEHFYGQKPEGGENWGEVRKRMFDCLKDIDKRHKNKTILIISHGDPLWLLEGTCNSLQEEELLEIKIQEKYVRPAEWRKLDFKNVPLDEAGRFDLHRPYIDEVGFLCPKCQGPMQRVPEVCDVWFDSGSMPFAQHHYPFEKKNFQFPAEYISEAIDQTRGWFYTLLAVSTLLGKGTPYKNVISTGHVLDEKGEKMSKSKGNIVDPWQIINKYGADAVRWYFYTVNQPGEPKLFAEKDIDQALKRFILILWNCFTFYRTYKGNKKYPPKADPPRAEKTKNILDKWIISRLNELILDVTSELDKYDVTGAARALEDFVVNDLSLWYIRRSRKRFDEAAGTLASVLEKISRLTAPFIPFLSEEIYRSEGGFGSVHLQDWPRADKKLVDKKLNEKMAKVRQIVALALAERAKAGIKVRQPLTSLQITEKIERDLQALIKDEVNVKNISFGKELKLDTTITPELKEEGIVREVIRHIQEMRKEAGLKPGDKIMVSYFGTAELNEILGRNKRFILTEIKAKDFKTGKGEKEVKIDQQSLLLAIKKL